MDNNELSFHEQIRDQFPCLWYEHEELDCVPRQPCFGCHTKVTRPEKKLVRRVVEFEVKESK